MNTETTRIEGKEQHHFQGPCITKYTIDNWKDVSKKLKEKLPTLSTSMLVDTPVESIFTDFHITNNLPDYSQEVIDILSPYIKDFSKGNSVNVDRIWTQTSKKYQYHKVHNHGNIGYSSVLFVDFDSTKHIGTAFYHSFQDFRPDKIIESYIPKVKEGDFIIFPAYVPHESVVNKSDISRRIISLNFKEVMDNQSILI